MNVQERLAQAMQGHTRVPLSVFIGCSCGWEPNQPRKWSDEQIKAQEDPDSPDPIDPEGDYDTSHATDDAWLAHVAAVQVEIMESANA